ncbi:MAG: FkbM family methyltransferase [Patescibacteria group bacterium]|uniref:FkbM family methyltransferase n=1 Tax=candidate division WWE3 bacterium TaxID=2053526 RepID=A0A955J1Y5_UNCKA|nr:FkbM family methyltransferase [candidate division WWE3 bacterium]
MFFRLQTQLKNPKLFIYNLFHLIKCFLFPNLVWEFDNGIRFYQKYLIGFQILRYKKINLHEPDVEAVFLDIFKSYKDKGCFIDVGAAGGYYSILIKNHLTKIVVHAFNPHPYFFKMFKDHLALNKVRGDVFQHKVAISDHIGNCDISGGWGGGIIDGDSVAMSTLDAFSTEANISDVFLLKIDIQGAELAALKGASELLKRTQFVICETHTSQLYKQCKDLLELSGHTVLQESAKVVSHEGGLLVTKLA